MTTSPLTVLLVDDDEDFALEYGRALERAEMRVLTAGDGRSALRLLEQNAVDVIVTDLNMPTMAGLTFLGEVRRINLDVPVVIVTGSPELDSAIAAVEYGAFQYLTKPLDAEKLASTVVRAASFHSLARLRREAAELHELPPIGLLDRASLHGAFDRALANLWMAYQPVVRWSEPAVIGYEALVRSKEPLMEAPQQLFDAAQRLGRSAELGRTIRSHVAEAAARAPDHLIFVNLHPSDLNDNELFSDTSVLSSCATHIVFDITERSELSSVVGLTTKVARLRKRGFRLAIDDLGAGFSSLSSFLLFEPDYVKLDPSLTREVHRSSRKRSLVRGIAQVCARDLGTQVICEGIESAAEREALIGEGLDLFQGYHFAHPAPAFPAADFSR